MSVKRQCVHGVWGGAGKAACGLLAFKYTQHPPEPTAPNRSAATGANITHQSQQHPAAPALPTSADNRVGGVSLGLHHKPHTREPLRQAVLCVVGVGGGRGGEEG